MAKIDFLKEIHDMIFIGGIIKGGTWGGPICASYVPRESHITECILWTLISATLYFQADIHKNFNRIWKKSSMEKNSNIEKVLDKLFSTIHLLMWFQVLYYKINIKSLVNLLQPCHISLLLQGLAVLSDGPISTILSLMAFPITSGAVSALVNPATEGLDQPFEKISFFIQHYLLLITPLYLLCRKNFVMLKLFNLKTLLFSNWFSMVLHWLFFTHLDRYFQVNVNFFLCPSEGMIDAIFPLIPSYMMWPTYRTFLANLMLILSIPLCYGYAAIAYIIMKIVKPKETLKIRGEDNYTKDDKIK